MAIGTNQVTGDVFEANYQGSNKLYVSTTGNVTFANNISSTAGNIDIAATKKIFIDGGGDTYIQEDIANNILFQSTSATFAGTVKTKGTGTRTIALESTDNAQNLNIDYIDNAGNPYSRIRWREGECDWTFQSNVTSSSADLVTISNTGNATFAGGITTGDYIALSKQESWSPKIL